MRFSDRILALLFAALGAVFFALTLDFPSFPGQRYGPALFPRILALGLIACSAILFLRRPREAAQPALAISPHFREPARVASFLAVPAAALFYLAFAESLGFIPVAFVILLALMLWLRVAPLKALAIAFVATWLTHWFFAGMMRVPLPRGAFMQFVSGG